MKAFRGFVCSAAILGALAVGVARAQSSGNSDVSTGKHGKKEKKSAGAGREMANGAGNIAGGVGKGAGSLAKGTGKGAVSLVTLHPIDAATNVGKGAVGAGKNVGVGTVKGTGKVAKGVGKAVKHLF